MRDLFEISPDLIDYWDAMADLFEELSNQDFDLPYEGSVSHLEALSARQRQITHDWGKEGF